MDTHQDEITVKLELEEPTSSSSADHRTNLTDAGDATIGSSTVAEVPLKSKLKAIRGKKKSISKPSSKTVSVEVQLMQNTTSLRSRKGDTGLSPYALLPLLPHRLISDPKRQCPLACKVCKDSISHPHHLMIVHRYLPAQCPPLPPPPHTTPFPSRPTSISTPRHDTPPRITHPRTRCGYRSPRDPTLPARRALYHNRYRTDHTPHQEKPLAQPQQNRPGPISSTFFA